LDVAALAEVGRYADSTTRQAINEKQIAIANFLNLFIFSPPVPNKHNYITWFTTNTII
jgi:hypothetical protein